MVYDARNLLLRTHYPKTIRLWAHVLTYSIVPFLFFSAQAVRAPFHPIILSEGKPGTRIATVYCHGYEHSCMQARQYLSLPDQCVRTCLLPGMIVTFNFADAGRNPFRFNRAQSSMGQRNEIERVNAAIRYAHTLDVDTIVVYGLSRGATALIGALGTYGHTYDKVCAAVLESPFADLQDVIAHVHGRIRSIMPRSWFRKLFCAFCAQDWDSNGSTALDFVAYIPEHIAVQLIATDTDHLVPLESTKKLWDALSERENSFFHIILGGRHGHLIRQNTVAAYAEIIDAFYKQHLEE